VLEIIDAATPDVSLKLESHPFGGCAIDQTGEPLPPSTLKACQEADAILMGRSTLFRYTQPFANSTLPGSIGGPKWGPECKVRPEQGLLALRKALGLYANIRPASFASDSLLDASPLKPEIARGVHIIVVRELIGGLYFGARKEAGTGPDADTAWDTCVYSVGEIERITRVAAQIALAADPPLAVHSVDKANVLASSRLWRRVVSETMAREFPTLALDHQLVDSAAMLIVASPRKLNGVVLTENLFGDMSVPPPRRHEDSTDTLPAACRTRRV
jgi:3-isopropylmalate dehydrogenase